MRPQIAVLVGVGVLITLLSFLCRPAPIEPPARRERPSRPGRRSAPAGVVEGASASTVRRNLFEYGQTARAASVATATPIVRVDVTPSPAPTRSPVKLVGVLQQAQGLRAAVAIEGEVVLAAAGQKVGGYTVVSIDAEDGVVLTAPSGDELRLKPPPD
jgi:hypothetical protein